MTGREPIAKNVWELAGRPARRTRARSTLLNHRAPASPLCRKSQLLAQCARIGFTPPEPLQR